MKKPIAMFAVLLLLLPMLPAPAQAQMANIRYVEQFDGSTIGAKMTNAAASCASDTSINCILVLSPILNAWNEGTLPTLASHISVLDFRTPGAIYSGNINNIRYVDCNQFACTATGLQDAIDEVVAAIGGTVVITQPINIGTTTITIAGADDVRVIFLGNSLITYTGNSVALDIGADARNDRFGIVRDFRVDLTGAGASAIGIRSTRTEHLLLDRPHVIGGTTTSHDRAIQIRGEGGGAPASGSFYGVINQPRVVGDWAVGIEATSAGAVNANSWQIKGGSVTRSTATPGTGTIGISITANNATEWTIDGTDIESWDTGASDNGRRTNWVPGRWENNTGEFAFGPSSDSVAIFNSEFSAPSTITWAGTNNMIFSAAVGAFASEQTGIDMTNADFRIRRMVAGALALRLDNSAANATRVDFYSNGVLQSQIIAGATGNFTVTASGATAHNVLNFSASNGIVNLDADGTGSTSFNVPPGSGIGGSRFGDGAGNVVATINSAGFIQFGSVLFSALGTPTDGSVVYCSDCTVANPCAGSGTGALAKRLNGAWVCN